jgi:hypothetical protein
VANHHSADSNRYIIADAYELAGSRPGAEKRSLPNPHSSRQGHAGSEMNEIGYYAIVIDRGVRIHYYVLSDSRIWLNNRACTHYGSFA